MNPASRARLLIACLLMVTTIDSAAAVCAYLCAHRNEPARASVPASHKCHAIAAAPGGDGSLAPTPVRCAPERPALTTARIDGPAFHRAIALDHVVALVDVANPATSVHLVESRSSAPPGAPPGAPLPLRI